MSEGTPTPLRGLLRDPALAGVALVAWSLTAPWALGYDDPTALGFHIPFAMAFLPLALLGAGLRAASALTATGGLLLAVAPLAFGYADLSAAAWIADALTGLALTAAALATLLGGPWDGRD